MDRHPYVGGSADAGAIVHYKTRLQMTRLPRLNPQRKTTARAYWLALAGVEIISDQGGLTPPGTGSLSSCGSEFAV